MLILGQEVHYPLKRSIYVLPANKTDDHHHDNKNDTNYTSDDSSSSYWVNKVYFLYFQYDNELVNSQLWHAL